MEFKGLIASLYCSLQLKASRKHWFNAGEVQAKVVIKFLIIDESI